MKKIIKFIKNFNLQKKSENSTLSSAHTDLESKVREATKQAVTQYSETLKILADYDRS